jgi:hypothetical protein
MGVPEDPESDVRTGEILRRDGHPSVLILGCQQDDVFVATRVLICATTLGGEEAIRVWLGQHGIRVAPQPDDTTSAGRPVAAGGGSSGTTPGRLSVRGT